MKTVAYLLNTAGAANVAVVFSNVADAEAFGKAAPDAFVADTLNTEDSLTNYSAADMVELYNAITGEAVKRFADRKAALKRTLAAIEGAPTVDLEEALVSRLPVAEGSAPQGDAAPQDDASKAEAPAKPAKKAAKKADKVGGPTVPVAAQKSRERGINLQPKAKVYEARQGSKQAILIDLLHGGATMPMLVKALSYSGKPWTEASVKTGLNWDVHSIKGYGVRTEFMNGEQVWAELRDYDTADALGWNCSACGHPDEADKDAVEAARQAEDYNADNKVPVYFLVLPKGVTAPLPHKAIKAEQPKTEPKAAKGGKKGNKKAAAAAETKQEGGAE